MERHRMLPATWRQPKSDLIKMLNNRPESLMRPIIRLHNQHLQLLIVMAGGGRGSEKQIYGCAVECLNKLNIEYTERTGKN